MNDWMVWLVLGGVIVIMELFTGTFYLLMIAIGFAAGALVAFLGWSIEAQLISAALIGTIATVSLRRSRFGVRNKVDASRDPNVNLDIGQAIQVSTWNSTGADTHTARTMYRGAQWDVQCVSKVGVLPGMYTIVEVRGSLLIVEPAKN